MNINDRVKITIQILIALGKAEDQNDLGTKLGYKSKSAFSQAVNAKNVPKILLEKLLNQDDRISKEWLFNGIGFIVNNKQVYNENSNEIIDLQKKYIQKLEEEVDRLKKELNR